MTNLNAIILRSALLASSGLAGLCVSGAALAQDAEVVTDAQIAEQSAIDEERDILVTGTRITDPNLKSVSPITTVTAEDLFVNGTVRLTEVLRRVPALANSDPAQRFDSGSATLNLRSLGAARTLTLVNGRRFVPDGGGSSAVDIGGLPRALIERVDVLTGGASAVYGADAVTGVVNFVLREDFEGVQVDATYGAALQNWDSEEFLLSVLAGTNFADDRGNVAVSFTRTAAQPLSNRQRDFARLGFAAGIDNPAGPPFTAENPRTIFELGNLGSASRNGAVIDAFGFFTPIGLNPDGSEFSDADRLLGADITFPQLSPRLSSYNASLFTNYEVSEAIKPYLHVFYSNSQTRSVRFDESTFFQSFSLDNPFLSEGLRDAIADLGIDESDLAYNRLENERPSDALRLTNTVQVVIGTKGQISDNISYDVSANIGRNWLRQRELQISLDRYAAAVDAVDDNGTITCRSNLDPSAAEFYFPGPASFTPGPNSGCIPFNPFTRDLAVNGASLDWLYNNAEANLLAKQNVFAGFISGNLGSFRLTEDGPISFVLGAEHRTESLRTRANVFADGDAGIGGGFINSGAVAPSIQVAEIFGEVALPIFIDQGPLLHELTLTGAFRYSDYRESGGQWTYNGGLSWAPVDGLRFRGSYARAVRAPNLGELFDGANLGNTFLDQDPCDVGNRSGGSEFREANCIAALTALGVDPATYTQAGAANSDFHLFDREFGGNPNLTPEVGDTFSVGVVIEPRSVRGLSLSLDYYDIRISDAIGVPGEGFLFRQCYDLPTLENRFCALLERAEDTGLPSRVTTRTLNVGNLKTRGFEFSANYFLETENLGSFNFSVNAHYLRTLQIQTDPTPDPASIIDERGITGSEVSFIPGATSVWVLNGSVNWNKGPFNIATGVNYSNPTLRLTNLERPQAAVLTADPFLNAEWNIFGLFSYQVNNGLSVNIGFDNLLNQKPDIGEVFQPVGPRGRAVNIGFSWDY